MCNFPFGLADVMNEDARRHETRVEAGRKAWATRKENDRKRKLSERANKAVATRIARQRS